MATQKTASRKSAAGNQAASDPGATSKTAAPRAGAGGRAASPSAAAKSAGKPAPGKSAPAKAAAAKSAPAKSAARSSSAPSASARNSDKSGGNGSGDSVKRAVDAERKVQAQIDAKDAKKQAAKQDAKKSSPASKSSSQKKPAATSSRERPTPPLPAQHQRKPGQESKLDPRPQFKAPAYRGSGKLDGKVALITGGDSGIGRAVAVLFAREGARVAIVYLSEDEDARETQQQVETEGQDCLLLPGDVKDAAFCRKAVARTLKQFGQLDVLVNNAAFQEHADSLEDITDEHFDLTMRTNIYGYFNMAKAALPHLKAGSAIINTGSETGLFGNAHLLDYSATKGAIHAFTMSLASNLVKRGIRVNAVAPGPVWTPLNPADKSPTQVARFGQQNPWGRPAQPEELSPAYVFLAAPSCSSYISGAILPVMGGSTG